MDLFEYQKKNFLKKDSPLASRIRPDTLDEFFGQEHIIGKDSLLYRAIKADKLTSIILYGASGTGKTTLAKIISNTTKSNFVEINATTSGTKELKEIIEKASNSISMYSKKTILFIDEIHRFNKAQQDYLLPYVENATIILIGATTENPYFEINKALISRSIIFELKPLSKENIKSIIKKAIFDKEKGFGNLKISIDEEALDFISKIASGDARKALNAIELAILTTEPNEKNIITININVAEQCIQKRQISYDKTGDFHYDIVSAFIKSMRGSDPDASLFYLAKMLYAGEDIKFIARRLIICASEDVGNADPNALQVAVSAFQAIDLVGMPEARIILAQAVVYIATAPKSNSAYVGINSALEDVKNILTTVPNHLKDSHYYGAKKLEHGKGYKYAHNYPNNFVKQRYLPYELGDKVYYKPTENGYEKEIKKYLQKINLENEENK